MKPETLANLAETLELGSIWKQDSESVLIRKVVTGLYCPVYYTTCEKGTFVYDNEQRKYVSKFGARIHDFSEVTK